MSIDTTVQTMTLNDIECVIKAEMNITTSSFVKIGYMLKQIRDRELYSDRYSDIWQYAFETFGISKSTASRFMAINDKFSLAGNSMKLASRYNAFSSSKLQEMLTLSDEQLEQVKPETTVKEIRGLKPKKEKPVKEPEGLKEFVPVQPDKKVYTECAAWKSREDCEGCYYDESGDCPYDRTGIEVVAMSQQEEPESTSLGELDLSVSTYNVLSKAGINTVEMLANMPDEELVKARNLGARGFNEIKKKLNNFNPVEAVKQPEAEEPIVESEEFTLDNFLDEQKDRLHMMLEVEKHGNIQPKKAIERQKIIVAALACMKWDQDDQIEKNAKKTEIDQIRELPIMRNVDQRKEFIENYEAWPIWIDIVETGERYYRYRLSDAVAIVTKVSMMHEYYDWKSKKGKTSFKRPGYYLTGIRINGSVFDINNACTFYECSTNLTVLADFLKEWQKGTVK